MARKRKQVESVKPWNAALQVHEIAIADLVPDPVNARKHGERNLEAIENSLRAFGQRRPIVVQKDAEGRLVIRAGNGTTLAAKRIGWTHVAAIVIEEGDERAIAFAIADNRTAELAEWDDEALSELLRSAVVDKDLRDAMGFSDAEIDKLVTPTWERQVCDEIEEDNEVLAGAPGAAFALKDDYRPPIVGPWDLPVTSDAMLADPPDTAPVVARYDRPVPGGIAIVGRGNEKFASPKPVLCTFTGDEYFQNLWDDTANAVGRWLAYDPACFTGVDYSTWVADPFPIRLWGLYRSRWVTRYVQEAGIKCWPNLAALFGKDDDLIEPSLAGFPREAPYVVRQFQTCSDKHWERVMLRQLKIALDLVKPRGLMFYGHADDRSEVLKVVRDMVPRVDLVEPYTGKFKSGATNKLQE